MLSILKISEKFNLAIHAMAYIASEKDKQHLSTANIARKLHASESHLAKVLQKLASKGLLVSTRGAKGGFVLVKEPDEYSLWDILKAIEGPIHSEECLLGKPICKPGSKCKLQPFMKEADALVREHLKKTTLDIFEI